ncbi:hypothetical protein [Streptosporangium sp. NPDC023615]|uniref:hypothetical protein n=1 Tax=Streptosporangium sp. NPDC023615 TaxID=3154794 RepID=UPI0034311000
MPEPVPSPATPPAGSAPSGAPAAPPGERGARPAGRRSGRAMPPPLRRTVLTAHVAISVGWLGLDLGLLALGVTALTTGDPALVRASYLAMDVLADTLIVPVGLTAVLTGVLLGLYTPWGLVRYHWVLVKLVTTTAALIASVFALRPQIEEAAAWVSRAGGAPLPLPDRGELSLVAAPGVALTVYLLNVALSTFKPFGRTAYGRRRAPRGTGRANGTERVERAGGTATRAPRGRSAR